MEDNKVVEGVAVEVVGEEAVEAKKGLFDKPKAFLDKHGKKVGAIALLTLATAVGYGLGKKAGVNSVSTDDYDYDSDDNDDDYNSEDTTEF